MPNLTRGVITRRRSALEEEYGRQEAVDDAAILEVLGDIHVLSDNDGVEQFLAPELQHNVDSMETVNIDLWDHVFREDVWKTLPPVRRVTGFEATHPGGSVRMRPIAMPLEEVPGRFAHVYRDWSSSRHGWAVLVPNRYLSEYSFHTGDTPLWTQGDVVGEGVNIATWRHMLVVDLGGADSEHHMELQDVWVAHRLENRPVGSEGGHGYGWEKRCHCFSPRPPLVTPTWAGAGTQSGAGTLGEGLPGETEHCADNGEATPWGSQPPGLPIADYDVPEDEEGVDGTQNSTARMTFPKVSHDLHDYMDTGKRKVLEYGSDDSWEEREEPALVEVD
ncbi:hypothetical protein M758_4G061300 [Ceratodon purpureus]|nr:hypothetical protein M758_4G061300 [Ceratodon purpureus]